MRKALVLLVVCGLLLGVVGTAFAENGTIWPTSSTQGSKVKPLENKGIWPF